MGGPHTARIAYSTNVFDALSPRAAEMCEDHELVSSVVVLRVGVSWLVG